MEMTKLFELTFWHQRYFIIGEIFITKEKSPKALTVHNGTSSSRTSAGPHCTWQMAHNRFSTILWKKGQGHNFAATACGVTREGSTQKELEKASQKLIHLAHRIWAFKNKQTSTWHYSKRFTSMQREQIKLYKLCKELKKSYRDE